MSSNNFVRLHAVIKGTVQGVFFRAHAQEWAQSLGLRGFVQNRFDGVVEVIAEGKKADLNELILKLKQGPSAARISVVEIDWFPATNEFRKFEIRR